MVFKVKLLSKKTRIRVASSPLELLLLCGPHYDKSLTIPYELLVKIFSHVVNISDQPMRDLCNLAQVCETWRTIIVDSPSLWSRVVFEELPITDANFKTFNKLIHISPRILHHVQEITLKGSVILKNIESSIVLKNLLLAPNLRKLHIGGLDPENFQVLITIIKAIVFCSNLTNLTIKNTKHMLRQQKWLADYLIDKGKHLEELHLTQSISSVSTQLFRSLASDYCPSLKVLDLSTCDFLVTRSFDAIQLARSLPNLVVLRVANISFRRVNDVPDEFGLTKLEELSMPIGMRDADRDDALLETLTYGSVSMTTLDIRGSSISAHALIDMPSLNVRYLHLDDLCPVTRKSYSRFIRKWRHSLVSLSLVKITCSETIKKCLKALKGKEEPTKIKEIDLEASDVLADDLKDFLDYARSLEMINLTSCRSLPRGCKGRYSRDPSDNYQPLIDLRKRLGTAHADSDTQIVKLKARKRFRSDNC